MSKRIEGLGHFEPINKPDPDDGEAEGSVEVDDDSIDAAGSASNEGSRPLIREQDRFLPIANVARIMKKAVPSNGKVSKDAKECMQECVSEFISFITSEAAEHCISERRKTISGEDVMFAMQTLGFDQYMEPLQIILKTYRESVRSATGTDIQSGEADSTVDELQQDVQAEPLLSSGGIHLTIVPQPRNPASDTS